MQNQFTYKEGFCANLLRNKYDSLLQQLDSIFSNFECIRARKYENENGILQADYYQYDRLFLNVQVELGNSSQIRCINSLYEAPIWSIHLKAKGLNDIRYQLSSRFKKTCKKDIECPQVLLNDIFQYPKDIDNAKDVLIKTFSSEFNFNIEKDDIVYDFVKGCYALKSLVEQSFLDKLMPLDEAEYLVYAKYTSLRTLQNILKSQKVRMNAITIMNDQTEVNLFDGITKNFKEPIEKDGDEYLFGNGQFITSLTPLVDDLNMWRLYGDNAKGVCLVLENKDKNTENLKQIRYVEPDILEKVKSFQQILCEAKINFCFEYLDANKHFSKHKDYKSEKEFRLLITRKNVKDWYITIDGSGNEIVSPYIDVPLQKDEKGDVYPLQLKKIILGPAMNYAELNKHQLRSVLLYFPFIEIVKSAINSYRLTAMSILPTIICTRSSMQKPAWGACSDAKMYET